MKTLITVTIAATILVGCSAISEPILTFGKKVNNEAIEAATFTLCYGSSIGSIRRNFTAKERNTLWTVLKCPDEIEVAENPED